MQFYKILIVDDDPLQREQLYEMLSASGLDFELEEAATGLDALQKMERHDFDVILTDKRMPIMDGDELCRHIRSEVLHALLPIIMLTGSTDTSELEKSFGAGAMDFVRKPYTPADLSARIKSAVQIKRLTDRLDSAESLLFALARMVEAKDVTTGDHCTRLSHMATVFGKRLGLEEVQIDALRRGGVLHDIGKLGIPDSILLKPAALTDDEWQVMREHTTIGANLCRSLVTMKHVIPIIQHHHERWDGSGYPHNLTGEAIPLLARVFQIVDLYDALSHKRPYKLSMEPERVIGVMQDETSRGWRDPVLIREFFHLLHTEPQSLQLPDSSHKTSDQIIYESIQATGTLDRPRNHL